MALAAAGPSALWYLTRATGAVTLLLLTGSVVLGIANIGRLQSTRWPRFVIEGVHRNVSLLAIALLVVHVITSVLDPFAGIRLIDAVVPFVGSYRPLWLGLGAFASDLLLAIAATSLVRRRLGHGVWRATHWLAYLCWPVAVLHTVGTGSDVKQLWLQALTAACILAVIVAVWARLSFGRPAQRGVRGAAFAASVALPAALFAWLPSGPLGSDWARRAGTPASVLAQSSGSTTSSSSSTSGSGGAIGAFAAAVTGTVDQSGLGNGLVAVNITLSVQNPVLPALALRVVGEEQQGGGVQMTSSTVSMGSVANPQRFTGAITSLDGTDIGARVTSADGQALTLAVSLRITGGDSASGTVQVSPTP
ncbi:MAG: ferric reductase-like transmembrane domain-containing protein [Solirubrobacteraceae bacterium]|jgi:DMSO/TMAO reductase YedYZ heme-binding membrane subunit